MIHIVHFFRNRTLLIAFFVGMIIIFAILVSSSYVSIKNIEVVRNNFNIDSLAIENELNIYIGKNILFFPQQRVVRIIRQKFPEFASVTVQKVLPDTLKIRLENHPTIANLKAYYILPEPVEPPVDHFSELDRTIKELESSHENSPEIPSVASPLLDELVAESVFNLDPNAQQKEKKDPIEQKSLLNRIGQAIFDQEENLELITIVIRGLSQPIEDRKQVILREHMDFLLDSVQYFTATLNMEITSVEYLHDAREIHLKTKDNLVIWLTLEKDYKAQIDKLKTIYEPAELNKEDIVYLDLRIREKVIYCPGNALCARY